MELQLKGKTAIVTGGSAGIGFACASALVKEGVHVLINGRNKERLDRAVSELLKMNEQEKPNVVAVEGDLADTDTVNNIVSTAFSEFKRVDILVNSAGSAPAGSFFDLEDSDFTDSWNLKVLGSIRMIKAIAPYMIKNMDGRIINIIGNAGRTPTAAFLPGGTTNAALLNFTKGISKELAKSNVRINAISPGVTATERANTLAKQRARLKGITLEEENEGVLSSIPLGKMVEPDEIASLALLFVSDLVPSLTGAEINIDGGARPGM